MLHNRFLLKSCCYQRQCNIECNINIIAGSPERCNMFVVNNGHDFLLYALFCYILDAISVNTKAKPDANNNEKPTKPLPKCPGSCLVGIYKTLFYVFYVFCFAFSMNLRNRSESVITPDRSSSVPGFNGAFADISINSTKHSTALGLLTRIFSSKVDVAITSTFFQLTFSNSLWKNLEEVI